MKKMLLSTVFLLLTTLMFAQQPDINNYTNTVMPETGSYAIADANGVFTIFHNSGLTEIMDSYNTGSVMNWSGLETYVSNLPVGGDVTSLLNIISHANFIGGDALKFCCASFYNGVPYDWCWSTDCSLGCQDCEVYGDVNSSWDIPDLAGPVDTNNRVCMAPGAIIVTRGSGNGWYNYYSGPAYDILDNNLDSTGMNWTQVKIDLATITNPGQGITDLINSLDIYTPNVDDYSAIGGEVKFCCTVSVNGEAMNCFARNCGQCDCDWWAYGGIIFTPCMW